MAAPTRLAERYSFAVIELLVVKQYHLWRYFFFKLQQAENAGTMVAGIVIGSLVFGLRPSR